MITTTATSSSIDPKPGKKRSIPANTLPNHSPDCVKSRVNHPMIDCSPHHLARVRREFGIANGKIHEIWQSRPTINLSADFFLSLSLERTPPGR